MEPDVPARRAPAGVLALALLADLAAITYLVFALVGFMTQEAGIAVCLAVYGLSRIVASFGLRHMKPFGAEIERISAGIWIALTVVAVIFLFKKGSFEMLPYLIPGVVLSVFEFVYLGRIKSLFAEPGLPQSWTAPVGWLAIAAIVGLLAFVVAPKLMYGGSHQKRTMADMRTIATAWEARATDINRYNAAAIAFPTTGVTVENLTTFLSPTYVKTFPLKDGWGHDWQFGIDQPWASNEPAQVYAIISYGKDGESQRQWAGGPTTNFDCDIVYSNGAFIQYPEGVQQQ